MKAVRLVSLGNVDRALVERARQAVVRAYRVPCAVAPAVIDPAFAFHPERGQYHSTTIIERLAGLDVPETIVGLTEVDLFIPILTYVFGEAQMGGRRLDDIEKAHILRVLEECSYNQTRTAEVLHIDRATLHNKLKRYGWARA